jgi:hypothetical protein
MLINPGAIIATQPRACARLQKWKAEKTEIKLNATGDLSKELKAGKKKRQITKIKRQANSGKMGVYKGEERVINPFFPLISSPAHIIYLRISKNKSKNMKQFN